MAYNEDKKSTELDELTALATGDIFIVGDLDDEGRAKKITKTNIRADFDATATAKGFVKLSVAPDSATEPIATGTNDTRIPSQDENNALAGTSGTPSATNKYVTNDDTAETGNSKVVRTTSGGLLNSSIVPITNGAASGYFYRDGTSDSGTQTIAHGLGRAPIKVSVFASVRIISYIIHSHGVYTSSGNFFIAEAFPEGNSESENDKIWVSSSYAIGIPGNYLNSGSISSDDKWQLGVISVDATNISIAWTEYDSGFTGTIHVMWDAIC